MFCGRASVSFQILKYMCVFRYTVYTHRKFTVSQILRYLYASRGGLCETELLALIPHLTMNFLSVFTEVLTDHLVLKYQGGLLTFAHEQVSPYIQCIIQWFPSALIKLEFFDVSCSRDFLNVSLFLCTQVRYAVQDYCFGKDEAKLVVQLRKDLTRYFSQFMK